MAPKLYYIPGSSPVRAVLMTADALGVKLDLELVDLLKKEQLKSDYIKVRKVFFILFLNLMIVLGTKFCKLTILRCWHCLRRGLRILCVYSVVYMGILSSLTQKLFDERSILHTIKLFSNDISKALA